ncbi:MAG TPA: glutamate 5-kinase [Thermoleophilaceae bacterium]|nr:glutamate 5-kinase [Thermoleophilaceae bacterium]
MATVVVKLGSSIVADERGEVRADILRNVCVEVARAYRDGHDVLLVTSGAIARGMGLMKLPARPRAMDELQAASAVGQGKLYQVYDELLHDHGIETAQVLLTFFDVSARSHYLNARKTLERILAWRVVPVINENDTTTTDEISFGDNDFLAAQVAILLGADRLVLLTDTEGLYTADPRVDPAAELVTSVERFDDLREHDIGAAGSPLGSGGMRSKVVAAEMATAAGIPVVIANGTRREALALALAGEAVGTRFAPQEGRKVSSFKLWLRYAKPTRGRLTVDPGAARALRERGTSLLPVGIVAVDGDFDAGDAVEVLEDGAAIGKGIVNLSSADLLRVKGMKTQEVREHLPQATEEAVHRDFFVLG